MGGEIYTGYKKWLPTIYTVYSDDALRNSTVVNCEKTGHCPHETTAVGVFRCCRCGAEVKVV